MMSRAHTDRPWYCNRHAIEEYKQSLIRDPEKLPMLKLIKVLRAILVNGGIFTFGAYAMFLGGDPTFIGFVTLLTFAGYNGLEYSDYASLVRAVRELQGTGNDDNQDE